jgi:hypothetical protein
MGFYDIAVLGAVVVAVSLGLAAQRYLTNYWYRKRQTGS